MVHQFSLSLFLIHRYTMPVSRLSRYPVTCWWITCDNSKSITLWKIMMKKLCILLTLVNTNLPCYISILEWYWTFWDTSSFLLIYLGKRRNSLYRVYIINLLLYINFLWQLTFIIFIMCLLKGLFIVIINSSSPNCRS